MMKKLVMRSAAKKAQIALAVMAVCGMSFVTVDRAYAEEATLETRVTALENTVNGDGTTQGLTATVADTKTKVEALNSKIKINGDAAVGAAAENSIVIGSNAYSNATNSVVIGTNAAAKTGTATGFEKSVAIGASAIAGGNQSTAIGSGAVANDKNSVAIGYGAKVNGENSVAIGAGTEVTESNTVAVGSGENIRRITGLAAGTGDNDAVNYKQMKDTFDTKVGTYRDITSHNLISDENNVNENLSAIDATIGTYASGTAYNIDNNEENATIKANISKLDNALGGYGDADGMNIDKDASAKANISALDSAIGSYEEGFNPNILSTTDSIKANLSTIDKYMGDLNKIVTDEDYSIIDRNGEKVTKDTLTVADLVNILDDKIGDLNKDNQYIVEDKDGEQKVIGAYNHIDGKTSLAENMEELDSVIGTTKDGTYVSGNKSVGENLNALDNQVAANTQAISRLDNKVNKVGAGAAALAALHPLDFDPDDKLTFAAGFGNYQGENAVALGAFYRPDEKVMFSVAGNMGNGENMINAGVSFALDRTAKHTTSKAAMAKKLADQDEKLAAQDAKIAKLEAMVAQLAAKK